MLKAQKAAIFNHLYNRLAMQIVVSRLLPPPEYNRADCNFVLLKGQKKIHLKNSVATCLSRNNVLVTLNNPRLLSE